jgi:hypothetical protein
MRNSFGDAPTTRAAALGGLCQQAQARPIPHRARDRLSGEFAPFERTIGCHSWFRAFPAGIQRYASGDHRENWYCCDGLVEGP